MNRREWAAEVMPRITANWPRHPLPDLSAAKFFRDLEHLDVTTVVAAVEALHAAGREFPPTSAHILGEIADQTEDAPAFPEAWQMILRAIRRVGSRNPQGVIDALAAQPAVAELASRLDIRALGMADEGDTTWYAQARENYNAVVRKRRRAITHAGVPSASLKPRATGELRQGAYGIREYLADLEPERPALPEGDAA